MDFADRNQNRSGPEADVFLHQTVVGTADNPSVIEINNKAIHNPAEASTATTKHGLLYAVDDKPPLPLTIFLAVQAYLTMFSSVLVTQLLLASRLCLLPEDTDRAFLVANAFFVSGIITLLQSTFGTRLPIVQGASFSFLMPAFVILSLDKFKCPTEDELQRTFFDKPLAGIMDRPQRYELWTTSMRELQGAIMLASVFEVLFGVSGIIGYLMRFIGPLTIGPVIATIGLSSFEYAGQNAGKYWPMAILTAVMVTLFSQILTNVNVPLPTWQRSVGWKTKKLPLFKLLPVFLSIVIAWLLCTILTLTDVLPGVPAGLSTASSGLHNIRVDKRLEILRNSAWIRMPYPFQFGWPTFSIASTFGMAAGVVAGMLESIGDYYACARLAGAKPPPAHAVNRGIAIEGLGCIISGAFGTGTGSTSYSENIGAIGITKVGSRLVIQLTSVIMIATGMLTKFGALFATIPDPVIGGIFCIMCGMVAAVGISNLKFVDLNSSRNLFVFGVPLVMGLVVPNWLRKNDAAILSATPYEQLNRLLFVLLTTSMFVAGVLALILDNILPGTDEERGLLSWNVCEDAENKNAESDNCSNGDANVDKLKQRARKTYDLPFGLTRWLLSVSWAKHIPIAPGYKQ